MPSKQEINSQGFPQLQAMALKEQLALKATSIRACLLLLLPESLVALVLKT
jgi:hypothetical protein